MIGRIYTVSFENQTVALADGDVDLFEVTPADDKPCGILGFTLDNVGGTADAGDAQEEFLRLAIIRGHTTSGNGTSTTARPMLVNTAAAGFAAEVYGATIASSGTPLTLWAGGWNVRVPLREIWPEELVLWCDQGNPMVVRLMAAVADDIKVSGSLYVCELP